jgi:hypothetical protein
MDVREGNRYIDDVRRHVPDMTKITTLAGYTIEGSPRNRGKAGLLGLLASLLTPERALTTRAGS